MLAAVKDYSLSSRFLCCVVVAMLMSSLPPKLSNAQVIQQAIGGVRIDASGVLQTAPGKLSDEIQRQIAASLKHADGDLAKSGLRVISLRALERQLFQSRAENKPLPPEVQYMAGLQRIEFVIVAADGKDVYLAGPGEGFMTDANGNVVGAQSKMPVIQLQDFLVAMRHVDDARTGYGITVSIDPTEEGMRNVNRLLKNLTPSQFDENAFRALEEAGGPQNISLTGVPKDSRFSQVLVAADYKMKRLAMGLEPTPDFLPSLLAMAHANKTRFKQMSPRFWMETQYEPVAVNSDESVWKIGGQGVCAKTEEEYLHRDGKVAQKPNRLAEKWAADMTEQYEALSQVQPIFRELRNLMDISVVAAIIQREGLLQKTGLELPAIRGAETVAHDRWNVPKTVPTQCSFAQIQGSLMVTTSGGVAVNSWAAAAKTETNPKLAMATDFNRANGESRWWWNAP